MVTAKTAAATYSEITLPEIDAFLKRAFRALRPKQGVNRGEVFYDLSLSDKVVIRVYTSIGHGQTMAAEVGADAIRVGIFSSQGRPLKGGKLPIVKRTQGWKNSLTDRIEEWMEAYHEHEDDLEAGRFVNW